MLMTLLLQCGVSVAQSNVIDEIVWVVGDEAIYRSEVEETRRDAQKNGIQWDGDPYCIIPEQLAPHHGRELHLCQQHVCHRQEFLRNLPHRSFAQPRPTQN